MQQILEKQIKTILTPKAITQANKYPKDKVVVIISGGMDSTTLLYDVITSDYNVFALSFNYGQRHKKELLCAQETCKKLGVPHKIVDISNLNELLQGSSLTSPDIPTPHGKYDEENMKQTVVPNRNMILLSIAAGYAISLKASKLFYGVHSGDHCIPFDESVITDKGKIEIEKLKIGDNILSANISSKEIGFKRIINKVNNGIRKDILKIELSNGSSLKMTSNHKVFKISKHDFNSHNGWRKEISEIKSDELKIGDWVINPALKNSKIIDNEIIKIDLLKYCNINNKLLKYDNEYIWFKKENKVKRFINSDILIKLLAWYITEGNCANDKQSNSYRVGISQSEKVNQENCIEIENLIKNWGFNSITKTGNTEFWFSGPTTRILKLCGRVSNEKKIPEELIILHPKLLFETLMKGDGYKQKRGFIYTTNSEILKEQISWLATILGYTVGITLHSSGSGVYNIALRERKKFTKLMDIINDIRFIQIKNIEKQEEKLVYDITVEGNHNFFAGTGSGMLVSNSIYPDCRKEFVEKLKEVIKIADWYKVELCAPYLDMDKGDIAKRGIELKVPFQDTWSCYEGKEQPCGLCGACNERADAFQKAGIKDPLLKVR